MHDTELEPPVPVPGCGKCAQLHETAEKSRARKDLTQAIDWRIFLRRHLRDAHGARG